MPFASKGLVESLLDLKRRRECRTLQTQPDDSLSRWLHSMAKWLMEE